MTTPEAMLARENADLRARLEEAEETLRAIRAGEVDALVVDGANGSQIFILESTNAESHRFRSDILGKVSDAVIAIDDEQRIIYLNAAAEAQYDTTASEALGRKLGELYESRWQDPDDEQISIDTLQRLGNWRGEITQLKRSGEIIHVESSVSRLQSADGMPSGFLSVIRDITKRRNAEEVLRRNEAMFMKIIEQAPAGVYVVDDQLRMNQVSATARPTFFASEPVIGKNLSEVLHVLWGEEIGNRLLGIFRHVLETGEPYSSVAFTEWQADVQGERSYDWETRRLTLPDGKDGVVCYFTDTTERVQAAAALRASEQELARRAEQLELADRSKDEFLAMLAHELRNPLAPLRNAAEVLQSPGSGEAENSTARQIISRQIENMGRMIDDLLDVSRITEGKIELRREPVVLATLLNSVVATIEPGCTAARQQLTVTLPSEPVHLYADSTRLEQVFGNLLGNACKYSGAGSHITLAAEPAGDPMHPEIRIRVADNGTGIDPALLPRIFDLFVQSSRTLDRAHGGLGIGLTIVHRLVKLHGGSIEARSEGLGRGTEFIVHLPVLTNPDPVAENPRTAAAVQRGLRILIVDDNEDSADSMAMLQEIHGHVVRTAHTGQEALALAATFSPEVVLLDIGLPGMDGYEVAQRLRAMPNTATAFIVALTGYGTTDDRLRALHAGFDEHLAKPADLEVLRQWLLVRS